MYKRELRYIPILLLLLIYRFFVLSYFVIINFNLEIKTRTNVSFSSEILLSLMLLKL